MLAFIVNLSSETKNVTVNISEQAGEFTRSEDIISGESIAVNNGSFSVQIPGRDARVLRLTPALNGKEAVS
jgi:hypothetical protein